MREDDVEITWNVSPGGRIRILGVVATSKKSVRFRVQHEYMYFMFRGPFTSGSNSNKTDKQGSTLDFTYFHILDLEAHDFELPLRVLDLFVYVWGVERCQPLFRVR